MEHTDRAGSKIRFGVFEVDSRSGELRKAGLRIRLQDQPFKVLCMLLEQPGEVVTREELKRRIWPEESFGDFDHAVNVAVAKLRTALGDSPGVPRFVETLPRRGYRFLAPVLPPRPVSAREHNLRTSKGRLHTVVMLGAVVILVAVAGFTLRKWLSGAKRSDLQTMNITRLKHGGGIGPAVAISPDGRYVAYARHNWQSQTSTLWMLQIATRTEVQIPEAEGSLTVGLTFSPDGNYLYMVRNDQSDQMTHHLFRTPALGGRPQHLLMGVDTPVSFSPDGHDFAYTRDIPKREAVELRRASAEGTNDHLIATIPGTVNLYTRGGPAWSPDGRTICLPVERVDKQKRWAMELVSVADGGFHELFSSNSFIGRPTWQPDGKSLIVGLADGPIDRAQLWKVSFPEGISRRITNDLTDYGYWLGVSGDGRTIATLSPNYESSVWSVPRSNPLAATLIHSNQEMYNVASGPDGRIFAIDFDGAPWVMNGDGSHPALFTSAREARGIRVCGRFAVFLSFKEGSLRLLRVNHDGSNPTELVTGDLSSLDCSARGESVYYFDTREPAKISRVSVEGGTPAVVERVLGENSLGLISVSPDGNYLAYTYEETGSQPVTRLAVIPASGGPPAKIFDGPVARGLVRWSPDSKNLDYVDWRSGVDNIWEQPLTGGAPKQFTKFTTADHIVDFTWSADGSALLLTRDKGSNEVVLISNFQ